MFPTLSHLIAYLTGVRVNLPIQTFGACMALAFWAAYLVFRSEFKRKEALEIIHPFPQTRMIGAPASLRLLGLSGVGGFIAGAKMGTVWSHRAFYIGSLQDFLFSFRGSLAGGLLAGAITILTVFFYRRRQQLAIPEQVTERLHPYQLMDRLLLYCGIFGFIGAILFAKFENTAGISLDPLGWLFTFNGLNYYGALIFGALAYLYITRKHGIPLAVAADIGSPGMMLAYGMGRIGCHLAGDGDWGIVNERPRPSWLSWAPEWMWKFRFPHNSVHQGVYIPGCGDHYCTELVDPVYPTSFYEAVVCLLLFALLWILRRKISLAGLLFFIFALLNGAERFLIEFIRVNPHYELFGWTLTQSQIIAVLWMGVGGVGIGLCMRRLNADLLQN